MIHSLKTAITSNLMSHFAYKLQLKQIQRFPRVKRPPKADSSSFEQLLESLGKKLLMFTSSIYVLI